MTNSPMKVKALSDWVDYWVKDEVFDLLTNEEGHAYVICHSYDSTEHTICDHDWEPLTPDDIIAGKSDQFICI